MKRTIGHLKGKPIVEGDSNKLTKNEILYKEENDNITLSVREDSGELKAIVENKIVEVEKEIDVVAAVVASKFATYPTGPDMKDEVFFAFQSFLYEIIKNNKKLLCLKTYQRGYLLSKNTIKIDGLSYQIIELEIDAFNKDFNYPYSFCYSDLVLTKLNTEINLNNNINVYRYKNGAIFIVCDSVPHSIQVHDSIRIDKMTFYNFNTYTDQKTVIYEEHNENEFEKFLDYFDSSADQIIFYTSNNVISLYEVNKDFVNKKVTITRYPNDTITGYLGQTSPYNDYPQGVIIENNPNNSYECYFASGSDVHKLNISYFE